MKDLVDQMKRSLHLGTASQLSPADNDASGDQAGNYVSDLSLSRFKVLAGILFYSWKNNCYIVTYCVR